MKVPRDYLVMATMLGCVVGFGWDAARCAPSSPEPDDTPAYARLYDQLLALEEAGKPLDAIRLVPAILGEDIPVQAFYSTLDAKRQQLLGAILRRGDVTIGSSIPSRTETGVLVRVSETTGRVPASLVTGRCLRTVSAHAGEADNPLRQ